MKKMEFIHHGVTNQKINFKNMKSNFEEKKEARAEKYQELAAKNEQLSDSAYKAAHQIGDAIPFGQPILVGHHSEGRHRAALKKIDNNMRKSVEASKKAAYYEARAESLLSNNAIFSDDPNAIDKLQEKIEKLSARQELYKQCNKIVKSKKSDLEKVDALKAIGLKEATAIKFLEPDQWGRVGIRSYTLTNNNAVINNAKKRLEFLEKLAKVVTSEIEINGVTIKINAEDNRVQIFFPGKPADEVRTELKRAGYHWAPSVGAWMRQISDYAVSQAKYVVNKYYPTAV